MKKVLVLFCALALTPVAASAQWEVGFDGGLLVNRAGGTTSTFFTVPNAAVRLGYLLDNGMRVESISFFNITRTGGTTFNTIRLMPGLVYGLSSEGESTKYVRGEFGVARTGGGGASSTQWALGGGVGMTKPLQDGVLTRLEVGVDRWLNNAAVGSNAFTQFRATAGVTIVLG